MGRYKQSDKFPTQAVTISTDKSPITLHIFRAMWNNTNVETMLVAVRLRMLCGLLMEMCLWLEVCLMPLLQAEVRMRYSTATCLEAECLQSLERAI